MIQKIPEDTFIYSSLKGLHRQCHDSYKVAIFCLDKDVAFKENRSIYQQTAHQLLIETIEKLLKIIFVLSKLEILNFENVSLEFKKFNHNINNLALELENLFSKREKEILSFYNKEIIKNIKYGLIRDDFNEISIAEYKSTYENYTTLLELDSLVQKLLDISGENFENYLNK